MEKSSMRDVRGRLVVPGDHIISYRAGCFFSSHSWHFFTVPPYSQYSGGRVQTAVCLLATKGEESPWRKGHKGIVIVDIERTTTVKDNCSL